MKLLKTLMSISVLALTTHQALAAPMIQKDADYFRSLDEDIAWFQSMNAVIPHSDTRGLFLDVYLSVSEEMSSLFTENRFNHPDWVRTLMFKYASLYRNALDCDLSQKCDVSPAWQKAFMENKAGKITPAGQLLLSISAHVNRDLPVALASVAGTQFDDPTYVQDFHTISLIFQRKMPDLIHIVQSYETCHVSSSDEKVIMGIVNHAIGITRDKAWNWGRKLSKTTTPAEEAEIMSQIENHAHNEDLSLYFFAPGPAYLICL